jgi:hypothetical protein
MIEDDYAGAVGASAEALIARRPLLEQEGPSHCFGVIAFGADVASCQPQPGEGERPRPEQLGRGA